MMVIVKLKNFVLDGVHLWRELKLTKLHALEDQLCD